MIAVTIPLAVRVVLIQNTRIPPCGTRHLFETLGQNMGASPFESHDFTRVGTFGRGIFRVGAIDIEAATVGQHFVQLAVVIWIGPLPLPRDFKPTRIEQRIFIFIVPNCQRSRQTRIMSDNRDGIGDRVRSGMVA